ncbi:MAG: hypothetical protein E7463_04250 [Ruminococcaceae bacterium]|nr:hypothetical protein [Oscillospiraceae bacterium]
MILFDSQNDISLVLEQNADEVIRLAAHDLQADLRRLSGKRSGFDIVTDCSGRSIIIRNAYHGEPESYTVRIDKEAVSITGSDVLGTVYGIYAFSRNCLNILPFYRLTDLFPAQKDSLLLTEQTFLSPSRAVRFRGWFLNDEDLLTDWKLSGGRRNIDYRFYQNVMDTDVLDMILETALRMEINLIIPSSFVDIDNPDEEKLIQAVCRRGMYVSQHHVEPMGVSYFGAENYIKKHGFQGETVSFIKNRERMEEIWRYYAQKWAKYGDHVIWQLGLRGKADQAVWKSDPNIPLSMKDRGAILTDAIGTQHKIICQTLNTDQFYSTATLWNEGSVLFGRDYLQLPETTVPVFSDFGLDQMFGEDLYSVGQTLKRPYGVYYHACFWWQGPHLTEGCNPVKMAYCYRDAVRSEQLFYSILNISNVRSFHISAFINAKILQSPTNFDAEDALFQLDKAIFQEYGQQVNEMRRAYYSAFSDFGDQYLRITADITQFYYHEYPALPFIRNAATDGQLVYFGKYLLQGIPQERLPAPDESTKLLLTESAAKFSSLHKKARILAAALPADTRLYFGQFVMYQIRHMQLLTEWCIACMEMCDETLSVAFRLQSGERACSYLEAILEERTVLESGIWKNWHRGDKKINISALLELTSSKKDDLKAKYGILL